jgi:hypothetical protein
MESILQTFSCTVHFSKGQLITVLQYRVHIFCKHTPGDCTHLVEPDGLLIMKILCQENLNILLHSSKCVISLIKILYGILP